MLRLLLAARTGILAALFLFCAARTEAADLFLAVPVSGTEGVGVLTNGGSVSIPGPLSTNLTVTLSSSDTTEVIVPPAVTLLAGETNKPFDVTIVDDGLIDGSQTAIVTAHAEGWNDRLASISVLDNETMNLVVSLTVLAAYETNGVITSAGTVLLSGTLATNVTITLTSSDTTELTVPASLTLLAGRSNRVFNVTLVDDAIVDGMQNVTITASAPGLVSGSAVITVLDNESPPAPSNPNPTDFATSVSINANLSWVNGAAGLNNDVYFGTSPVPTQLLGTTFGSTWNLPQLLPNTTYYWQIVARAAGTTPGPIWRFTTRSVDHFEFADIGAPKVLNQPFPVTITARDEANRTVTNFTGPVNLAGFTGAGINVLFGDNFEDGSIADWNNDGGPFLRAVTNGTAAGGLRSVTLIGGSNDHYRGISHPLPNIQPAVITFHVRTSATNLAGAYFVTGSESNITDSAVFFFMTPSATMGLFADAGYVVPYRAGQWYKITLALDWSTQRINYYTNDVLAIANIPFRGAVSNLNSVYLYNFHNTQAWWDEIQFSSGMQVAQPVALTPTNTTAFTNGIWSGNVTVLQPANNMYLVATDTSGHSGASTNFSVLAANDLGVSIAAQPEPVLAGGFLTNTITVTNSGPAAATAVTVTNFLPPSVSFVSATPSQGSCALVGGRVECTLGSLGTGAATIQVVTIPPSTGQITNRVTIGRAEVDSDSANNSAESITTVIVPSVSIGDASVFERNNGLTPVVFSVQLSRPSSTNVTVNFTTVDGSATAGSDYVSTNGVLIFPPGQTNQTITVLVIGDTVGEPTEDFSVLLSNPVNANLADTLGAGTILNDDLQQGAVGIFDNATYVDTTSGGNGAESDNLQATVASLGFVVATFTDLAVGVNSYPQLIIPEQEVRSLGPDLPLATRSATSNFVFNGGKLIVHGTAGGASATLLNTIFGFAVQEISSASFNTRSAEAGDTAFGDDPPTIPDLSATTLLTRQSLPPNARNIYTNNAGSVVVLIEYGNGLIIFIGWDWFNAAPLGIENGGWLNVLNSALVQGPLVPRPPSIVGQPINRISVVGGTATFSVAVTGTSPFSYQWRQDGTNISGATNSIFTILNVQSNHIGRYSVAVTNLLGADTSTEATLSVLPPSAVVAVFDDPFFVDTTDNFDAESDTVQATLEVLGFPVIPFTDLFSAANTYRSILIPEQELGTLAFALPPATQSALSNFVSNGGKLIIHGSASGAAASLLNLLFGFSVQESFSSGLSHNLSGEVSSTAFADDPPTILDNFTTTVLSPASLPPGALNIYTNANGSSAVLFEHNLGLILFLGWDWSNAKPMGSLNGGWLNVLESAASQGPLPPRPPTILSQPQSRTAFVAGSPTFSVSVSGSAPFAFQWRQGGTNISDATNSTYTILNVQHSNAGNYSVVITNLYGSVTSAVAVLNVINDPGFSDDFDPGIDLLQWNAFGGTVQATNHGGSVSGTKSLWFGGFGFRYAESRTLNTQLGGVMDFYLRLGSGFSQFWEQVDLPFKGIVLEYSTDDGANWFEMGRYDTVAFTVWTRVIVELPLEAQAPATRFRWSQSFNDGECCDHWALDNVSLNTGPRPPVIVSQPANQSAVAGGTVTFSLGISGSAPLFYQWRKDGTNLLNRTNALFTISNVQSSNLGSYSVIVTNAYGSVTSAVATLTLLSLNGVVAYFTDQNVTADGPEPPIRRAGLVPLKVTDISTYNLNSASILFINEESNGDISPALRARLPAIQTWIAAGGKLIVHDRSIANLTPNPFLLGTAGITGTRFETASIDVIPPGNNLVISGPFGVINNATLDGGSSSAHGYVVRNLLPPTTESFLFTDASPNNLVSFMYPLGGGFLFYSSIPLDCYLTNGGCGGSIIGPPLQNIYTPNVLAYMVSQNACTNCPPRFTQQPNSQNVLPGTNVTIVAGAVGTGGPIRYQWRFEGANILNATNASYSFTNASLANHGAYSVTATDIHGTSESATGFIYVLVRPSIVTQPQSQTVAQGQTAFFTVVATGAQPLFYRWFRGGFPYLTSSVPFLVLTNNQSNTTVRVAVTNLASGVGGVNSAIVQLTVMPDFDGDGMADSWEALYGLNTNNAADAFGDLDGDGMSNRDEYIARTIPTNPLSLLKLTITTTNSALLEFVAQSNTSYMVQFQTDVGFASWSNLMLIGGQSQTRTVQVNAATLPPPGRRFYRVATPPDP